MVRINKINFSSMSRVFLYPIASLGIIYHLWYSQSPGKVYICAEQVEKQQIQDIEKHEI